MSRDHAQASEGTERDARRSLGPSRFVRSPRLTIALAIAALVVMIEVALRIAFALFGQGPDADQERLLRQDGIEDVARFWRELERLSKELAQYHPYRWYALPPSVSGRYHATDSLGFRNGPLHPASAKIAFFGGSTTYSVRTTAEGSIPGIINRSLDRERVEAVNYGLGGYGSTNELMTLIEVTRQPAHGIRWAVFLDGVNEASRYAEKWQDQATAPFYGVMGYRWEGTRYALANELGVPLQPRTAIGRSLAWLYERLGKGRRAGELSRTDEDYRRAGVAVAEIYFRNIIDVRALAVSKGIAPLFFLQPTIFDLSHPTARERAIQARAATRAIDIGRLYTAAYRAIRADPRFATLGVLDLGDALEARRGEIFFDDCHLTSAGNALLAARIRAVLRTSTLR